MKTFFCLMAACFLSTIHPVMAQQIEVSLTMAYSVFVIGEPVLVQIDALNMTRTPVNTDPQSKDKFFIEITYEGKYNELKPFNAEPILPAFVLNPGQTLQQKIEIDKWFALYEAGKYIARAIMVHDGVRYESTRRSFDIVPGIPLKEGVQMFVNHPTTRHFKLVHWTRNHANRLFLRMEDSPGGQAWDTLDLGLFSKETEPKLDISPDGEVTVVHRATQDAFLRTMVWSLPDSVEVAERTSLLDPDISASQRVKSLYGDLATEKKVEKPWWKFWGPTANGKTSKKEEGKR